jgi:acetylornithine/succinyldiaminopimelate/putrescine aminotransferase/predicted amino acid dehydrogenase/acyl-coenzyme A synthetase/AMP-(fatty) acid ligase
MAQRETIDSVVPIPASLGCHSLPDLLLRGRDGVVQDPSAPILLGTLGKRPVDVTLGQLRSVVLDLSDTLADRNIRSGDTVCLVRPPRTSELALAATYAALSAMGVRVLLPMYPELPIFTRWLAATGARLVIWNAHEVRSGSVEADAQRLELFKRHVDAAGVPLLCLHDDLSLEVRLAEADPRGPSPGDARIPRLLGASTVDTDCLILTTAGTSGASKLVRYVQGAFLRSCASWEAGGLFDPARQGGRGLCLLFSHSMGIRAFWNAIWTGQAICLIPPEWFAEHPERVRGLLLHMRPIHVTGGPAVYRALLELARVFPDLKENGLASLRCLVSSGATFDAQLATSIESGLGLDMQNAFGTTETMQVLSTLVAGGRRVNGMGAPLPGVRIDLEPIDGDGEVSRLLVQSPFGYSGYLPTTPGGPPEAAPDWYATGDVVRHSGDGISYVGRERDEFVKDAFGVKVPRSLLAERYSALGDPVVHLEWYPLREEPGLGALIFVGGTQHGPAAADGRLTGRRLLARVRGVLEARHESFQLALDDLELRHLTVARFACLAGPPPRTPKGNVSRGAIESRYGPLLEELLGRYVERQGISRLDRDRRLRSSSTRFVRPRVGESLRLLRLDKEYIGAQGDRMTLREHGETYEVVDFVGGFGTTLLGHRHPDVVAAARRFLEGQAIPLADQGSARRTEGEFARRLAQAVTRHAGGSFIVRFASTGAEAVEMALAHSLLERGERLRRFIRDQRRFVADTGAERVAEIVRLAEQAVHGSPLQVLAVQGAYHGQSLGARSLSELRRTRPIFERLTRLQPRFLAPDGHDDIDAIIREAVVRVPSLAWRDGRVVEEEAPFTRILCAIAEPIRGEGGVTRVSRELLARLAQREFPLIADEIQCGLGRSGRFVASEGVRADYYLFGKALGGGLAKISALLVDRARYVGRFDEDYVGTFAGDALSCTVGLAVLDVLERDDVPGRARERGEALRKRVASVAGEHPDVIAGIDGDGLMLGVELAPTAAAESMLIRMALTREHLGLLASSYLLNRWHVRVLPTLSAPNTLRLEPSAFVDDGALDALARALRAFCSAVANRDLAELLGVLVPEEMAIADTRAPARSRATFSGCVEPPNPGAVRIAFVNHFVRPDRELAFIEPSLGRLPTAACRSLFHRLVGLMDLRPGLAFARNLFDGRVWFASIVLPADAAALEECHRSGEHDLVVERIQEAVDLGRAHGCTVCGLGAYTSIVTRDGSAVAVPPGMRLSTGNALTVAIGARRVLQLCQRPGLRPDEPGTRLAIVGASGNIGAALAHRFAGGQSPFRRIVLVGRRLPALQALADKLRLATGGGCDVGISTKLDAIRTCNVIVVAAATNEPLIFPRDLPATGAVVLADLSVPSVVATQVRRLRHVHQVALAGCVRVPGTPDFAMASHIAPGTAFSCAAEAMVLALSPDETAGLELTGPVRERSVNVLEDLAVQWGLIDAVVPAAGMAVGG